MGIGWGLGGDLTVSIVNALHVWQLSLPNRLPTSTLAAEGNVGDLTRHLLHSMLLSATFSSVAIVHACANDAPPGPQISENRGLMPLICPGCGRWGVTLIGALLFSIIIIMSIIRVLPCSSYIIMISPPVNPSKVVWTTYIQVVGMGTLKSGKRIKLQVNRLKLMKISYIIMVMLSSSQLYLETYNLSTFWLDALAILRG